MEVEGVVRKAEVELGVPWLLKRHPKIIFLAILMRGLKLVKFMF